MRIRAALAVTLVALAVPAAGHARPGPPLAQFDEQPSPFTLPVSDGVRYFVSTPSRGVVRIHDTATGARRDAAVSENCIAVAAKAGTALLSCYDDPKMPHLLDLRTGKLTPVPRKQRLDQHYQHWYGIGRHWIAGTAIGTKPAEAWVNLTTGELRVRSTYDGGAPLNLDDPKLRPYPPSVFAIDGPRSIRFPHWTGGDRTTTRMWLAQPGPDVRLSRCDHGCQEPALSSGLATWSEGTTARAFDIRRRLRLGWRIVTPEDHHSIRIVHTRSHVLIAAGDRAPLWARVR